MLKFTNEKALKISTDIAKIICHNPSNKMVLTEDTATNIALFIKTMATELTTDSEK
ncbi:MAG: hypothetical protein PHU66_09325 [Bacteroidaceae bacterium]|nr:hypothetical protein [Bacteroidaceae bacterium]